MKEKKELIDVVVDKLKNMKEPPYRTGSWEKFKQLQTSKPVVYRRPTMWYAAASVLLCLGVAAGFWIMNNDRTALEGAIGDTVAVGVTETPQERNTVLRAERREGLTGPEMIDPIVTNVSTVDVYSRTQHGNTVNRLDRLEEGNGLQIKEEVSIPQLAYLPGKGVTYGSHQDISLVGSASDSENRILANSALDHYNTLTMKPMESQPRNTHIRLGKQFELGLFISPYATSNQMNVGGGLVVSYKLNKVLSIRTGASYNNYEIQMVKNPIEESST
ncbi:MAG TPA: hypothetical protein PKA53_04755, partial [Sphingobacterium sp.]|nr:hypothetical protein [Sphingobacterium sp.]